MKKFVKLFAIALAASVILSLITIISGAEAKGISFSITTAEAGIGETIDVRVIVNENLGFAKLRIGITYDKKVLELVDARSGFNTSSFEMDKSVDGKLVLGWSDKTNNTCTGKLVTMTFKVKDTAQTGKLSMVNLSVYEATSASGVAVGHSERSGGIVPKKTTAHLTPYGTSLYFGTEFRINVWVITERLDGNECFAVVTKKHDKVCKTEDEVVTIPSSEWLKHEGTNEIVGIPTGSISSTEMICDVEVQVYAGNADKPEEAEAIGDTITVSVQKYATEALKLESFSPYYTLLVDMLNYGAAAQINFDHNPVRLPNTSLTEEQKAYASSDDGELSDGMIQFDGCFSGTTLTLSGGLHINFYFENINPTDTAALTASIEFTNHLGELVSYSLSTEDITVREAEDKTFFIVTVSNLTPADFGSVVTCRLYGADKTTPIGTVSDSVELYVRDSRHQSSSEKVLNLYTQIIKYGKSVNAIFAKADV